METRDLVSSEVYTLESVVHRDISGLHTTLATSPPKRKVNSETSDSVWDAGAIIGSVLGVVAVAGITTGKRSHLT